MKMPLKNKLHEFSVMWLPVQPVWNDIIHTGSAVTQVRCGGMFHSYIIANFPQGASVKKSVKICQYLAKVHGQTFGGKFLLTHGAE